MDELTYDDINNVVDLAKKFIEDNNFEELHNKILYDVEFDNFRRIYGNGYSTVIYYIIIEYGNTVQTGGCPPCIGILARIIGKQVIKKGVKIVAKKGIKKASKKARKKAKRKSKRRKSKKYRLRKKLSKRAKREARETIEESTEGEDEDDDDKKSSWW